MQALHIHWSARRRAPTAVALLLALAALACLAWVAQNFEEADAEWQSLQARQARLKRAGAAAKRGTTGTTATAVGARDIRDARDTAPPGVQMDKRPDTPLDKQLDKQSVAQMDAQLQRPWDALLHHIERSGMQDVALLSLDAQAASGSLHLVGEAKDMAHALAYVKKLRDSDSDSNGNGNGSGTTAATLSKVYLTGQEDKLSGTQRLQRFSLDASWGAAP